MIFKKWIIVDPLLQETSFGPLQVLSLLEDRLGNYSQLVLEVSQKVEESLFFSIKVRSWQCNAYKACLEVLSWG